MPTSARKRANNVRPYGLWGILDSRRGGRPDRPKKERHRKHSDRMVLAKPKIRARPASVVVPYGLWVYLLMRRGRCPHRPVKGRAWKPYPTKTDFTLKPQKQFTLYFTETV